MAVATSSPPRRTDDAVQTFDDCVVLLCYNHEMRCGLVEGASKGLWLPYKDIAQGESWESAVELLLKEVGRSRSFAALFETAPALTCRR